MTNSKSTKGALLVSSISLLLCFAMLLGTTFAWFTDSATSAGNKIVAGKLDVELLMHNGTKYENISTSKSPIFGTDSIAQDNNAKTLWEPGKTQVAYLAIENAGNLDLKYNVNLIVKNVAKDLYKAMEYSIIPDAKPDSAPVTTWTNGDAVNVGSQLVTVDAVELKKDTTHYFALAIHMNEDAGNEYQEGQVDFDIVVNATQLNSEADSFDNTYDKDATYELSVGADGKYTTNNMAGLSKIAELASEDSSITEVVYVDTEGNETTVPVASSSAALDEAIGNDNSIVVLTSGAYTVDNAKDSDVTIVGNGDDTTLTVEHEGGGGEANVDYGLEGANVLFENMTIAASGQYAGYARVAKATYNNCTIKGVATLYGESIFNNCNFDLSNDYVWTWGAPYAEFNDCIFENSNGQAKAILVHNTVDTEIIVKNCKFIATTAAQTWDEIPVAAVSIDPATTGKTATVRFEGTNTVSSAFNSLYQVKYAAEVNDVTIYVNGEKVAVTAMK